MRTEWGEPRPEGPGKRIPLEDGQKLQNIDFGIKRAGAVSGRIVDEFGEPVTDVSVTAMRYQYVQGSRRLLQSGRNGQTNEREDKDGDNWRETTNERILLAMLGFPRRVEDT